MPVATNLSHQSSELRKEAAQLLEQCRDAARNGRRLVKFSSLGGDPEESFEQAFASLGFSYIKDKAPRLLDYLMGFQLVDRNEDNTKAIGVFGFQLGKQWIYAPIFFLNGDIKGHELLYLKGQDLFIPMKENWVNYLLAKRPHLLGEQTSETSRNLGVLQPDIRKFSQPPTYGKYSSYQPKWYRDFLPTLGKMATESLSDRYVDLSERLTLPELCSSSITFARMAKTACDQYPEINRLCRQFYGNGWLKQALTTLKDKATKKLVETESDHSILADTSTDAEREQKQDEKEEVYNKDASFVLTGQRETRKRAAGPPVEIRMYDDITITCNDGNLSESERERLFRDGYLVKDYRKGDEVSKVYSTQRKVELTNPDASGIYDILTKPGELKELLVVNEPQTAKGKCDFATVVRTDGQKNWLNAHRATLWALPQRRGNSEQREWFDGAEDVGKESLNNNDLYMVLSMSKSGNIEGSTPFRVMEDLGDGRYRVMWLDHSDKGRPVYLRAPNHSGVDRFGGQYYDTTAGNWALDRELRGDGDLLFLTDREGTSFKSMHGTLYAPSSSCKVIRISDTEDEGDFCCYTAHSSKTPAIEPGNWGDLQMQIIQKTASMKVYSDGDNVSINAGPMSTKKAALFELIKSYGLREKQAKHVLREAEAACRRGSPATYHVKFAQGYPALLGQGPTAPTIPPQEYGYDGSYGNYQTTYPQEDFEPVSGMDAALTDPSVYDPSPEAMADPMSMQTAQRAGQTGQKEVFDTAMINSLLRAVRQDSMVDRYTGDLMKALDRLGRILFMFYWHNDDFVSRYGKADAPELEDTLRNTFENLGDLLLFLREKSVEPLLGGVVGEPDIQDAAM